MKRPLYEDLVATLSSINDNKLMTKIKYYNESLLKRAKEKRSVKGARSLSEMVLMLRHNPNKKIILV